MIVVPGQIVSKAIEKVDDKLVRVLPGPGVRVTRLGGIDLLTATTVGELKSENESAVPSVKVESRTPSGQVLRPSSVLPQLEDVVLARVAKITARQAHVKILVVANEAVTAESGLGLELGTAPGSGESSAADIGEGFRGIIRVLDVRQAERDKVKILDSFRPGDIVRASVLSLGDGTNYYLSTARNDLGVVFAKSRTTGETLYAKDWETMRGVVTGVEERRKVANPMGD